MTKIEELEEYADENGYVLCYRMMSRAESVSAPISDGSCGICIDPTKLKSRQDYKMKLSHEEGHCSHLAFYNAYSPFETVERQEHKALVWQINRLVPKSELDEAIKKHVVEVWELAEYFDVPESFMRQAIAYYKLR